MMNISQVRELAADYGFNFYQNFASISVENPRNEKHIGFSMFDAVCFIGDDEFPCETPEEIKAMFEKINV